MEAIDSTIINTAIPAISHSLVVEPVDLKIALISYLLSLAIFIPISGWLSDKFGSKQVFIFACGLFTLSSLACGFSTHLNTLVVARFIQGLGGALTLPVGRLIILRTYGRKHLIATMNRVVTIGALGIMLGPLIGGLITDYFSWHWIFWINVPVGMLTIILAYIGLERSEGQLVPALDKRGFILFGTAVSGLIFGFSALSETAINLNLGVIVIITALIILLIYIKHSRQQSNPIVNTKLLNYKTFQIAVWGNLLSRLGYGGLPFLLPLLFQIGLSQSATLSGLLLAPTALGVLTAKKLSLPLLRILGYKCLLIVNTISSAFSIAMFAKVGGETSFFIVVIMTFIYGFIVSLQYSSLNSLAYAEIEPEQLSAATSIMSTTQQLAQSLGVASSALFIRFYSPDYGNSFMIAPAIFHLTFISLALLTLASSLLYLRLSQNDGQEMLTG
ncbi:MAG: MFS transporter [Tatlockia sp.]|nr:MFS transporter [Tatlockia sp.]